MSHEALNKEQFFHFSPAENRESIRRQGLLPGRHPHVFMTSDPAHYSGFAEEEGHLDMWRINTKGLKLRPDPHTGDAMHGAMIHHGAIPPERLHHEGDAYEYALGHGAFDD